MTMRPDRGRSAIAREKGGGRAHRRGAVDAPRGGRSG